MLLVQQGIVPAFRAERSAGVNERPITSYQRHLIWGDSVLHQMRGPMGSPLTILWRSLLVVASIGGRPLMWRAMPARLKARGLFLGAGGITASFGNKVSAFFTCFKFQS